MQLSYFCSFWIFKFLNFWIFEFLDFWCWHVVLDDSKTSSKTRLLFLQFFAVKWSSQLLNTSSITWKGECILRLVNLWQLEYKRKLLPPLLLVYSYDGRIYHQEVLNLTAPDFLFWENQLALPQLNRFLSAERGCLLAHLFSLALFWTHQWTQIVCMQIILKPVPTLMKINLPTYTKLSIRIQTIMGTTAIGVLFQILNE